MKRLVLMAALLFSGAALAQPGASVEVQPGDPLDLARGQTKVLRFTEPVSEVVVLTKGVVDTKAVTDRQMAISGIGPGTARIIVFSRDGNQIYDSEVTVTPEPGRIVKIYGQNKDDDMGTGYTALFCNEFGCGRPDYDIPRPQVTVQRIKNR